LTAAGSIQGGKFGITLPYEHIIVDLRHSLSGFDAILDDVDIAAMKCGRSTRPAGSGKQPLV
jgi:predicted metal-dependent phosphotriesterase family hydrolase